MNKTIETIYNSIANEKQRSAWNKGVNEYAFELLESLDEAISGGYFAEEDLASPAMLRSALLNGAGSWSAYSWGGCSLIYNEDIAERLCTPSELKRTRYGEWRLNRSEEWLDVQGRALFQAASRICRHARKVAA
jgi:hypothetical protein